jgi:hypothetical protein
LPRPLEKGHAVGWEKALFLEDGADARMKRQLSPDLLRSSLVMVLWK